MTRIVTMCHNAPSGTASPPFCSRGTNPHRAAYYHPSPRPRPAVEGEKFPGARNGLRHVQHVLSYARLRGLVCELVIRIEQPEGVPKMKMTSSLLAAALMLALPMGGALACTVGNWNGANTATNADTGGPDDGVARYSGVCALSVGSGDYVIDNSPNAEGKYRARFYVLTGNGNATIFKATASDDGGGASVIEVTYNGSAFAFSQNGSAVGTVNAAQNKWYSVEMAYESGTSFNAWVWGAGSSTEVGSVSGVAGAGTVSSAMLGISNGSVTSNFNFDAFESTRGDDRIERLCRGDANNSNNLNAGDASAIISEYLGGTAATGQPDANEDGMVNPGDASTVMALFLAGEDDCS